MKNKYASCGLNYDLIIERFPDLNEFEDIANSYLSDPFFYELQRMLDSEDYEMAKDATKGLFVLASSLCLYPLYEALLEIYEDLEYETYENIITHYEEMMKVFNKIRGIFNA